MRGVVQGTMRRRTTRRNPDRWPLHVGVEVLPSNRQRVLIYDAGRLMAQHSATGPLRASASDEDLRRYARSLAEKYDLAAGDVVEFFRTTGGRPKTIKKLTLSASGRASEPARKYMAKTAANDYFKRSVVPYLASRSAAALDHAWGRYLARLYDDGAITAKDRDSWQMPRVGGVRYDADGNARRVRRNPQSKFDKLAAEIAREYQREGYSPAEAERIGRATAAKIGRAKYGARKFAAMGRAGRKRAAKRGTR